MGNPFLSSKFWVPSSVCLVLVTKPLFLYFGQGLWLLPEERFFIGATLPSQKLSLPTFYNVNLTEWLTSQSRDLWQWHSHISYTLSKLCLKEIWERRPQSHINGYQMIPTKNSHGIYNVQMGQQSSTASYSRLQCMGRPVCFSGSPWLVNKFSLASLQTSRCILWVI